jgi:DNA-binding MarR family transcriptional regulator
MHSPASTLPDRIRPPIIANRGEFVDVLRALARGRVLVRLSDVAGGCTIDGSMVYHSYDALQRYGLIREYDNPDGFPAVQYYRLTEDGREFAQRAVRAWRQRPLLERLAVRLMG